MSIQITTTTLPVGYVGQAYHATLLAQTLPAGSAVLWEIRNALPIYIALNVNTGVLSGQCARRYWSSINIVAQNLATGDIDQVVLSLYVAEGTDIEVLTGSLGTGVVGQALAVALVASGGTLPYAWQAAGLPAGLVCSQDQIVGTPTQAGDFSVTLQVTDSSVPQNVVSRAVPLQVNPALAPLRITTNALALAQEGQTYAQALLAVGGLVPYIWAAQGLPDGLGVESGVIAGVPTQSGNFDVQLHLIDSASPPATEVKTLPLAVSSVPTALAIVTTELATAKTNTAYYQLLQASGGIKPYLWASDGLPIGLFIDGDVITGQPAVSGGAEPLNITVTDSLKASASAFFWLTISAG